MNKSDLIEQVAKVVNSKKEANAVIDTVFSSITHALKNAETVAIAGFGTFKINKRSARRGRNPQTGEEIEIKAANVPKFVPGKALKDAVN